MMLSAKLMPRSKSCEFQGSFRGRGGLNLVACTCFSLCLLCLCSSKSFVVSRWVKREYHSVGKDCCEAIASVRSCSLADCTAGRSEECRGHLQDSSVSLTCLSSMCAKRLLHRQLDRKILVTSFSVSLFFWEGMQPQVHFQNQNRTCFSNEGLGHGAHGGWILVFFFLPPQSLASYWPSFVVLCSLASSEVYITIASSSSSARTTGTSWSKRSSQQLSAGVKTQLKNRKQLGRIKQSFQ